MQKISLIPYSCGAGAHNKTCADGPEYLKKMGLAKLLKAKGITPIACTIGPCKGYKLKEGVTFEAANKRRERINQKIIDSAKAEGRPVIRLDLLLADKNDKNKIKEAYRWGSDPVHPDRAAFAELIQIELGKIQTRAAAAKRSASQQAMASKLR